MTEAFTPDTYSALLSNLSSEQFTHIVGLAPRQAKESYFARHGIRAAKSKMGFEPPGAKTRARLLALHAVFSREEDETLAEEILRRYLLSLRKMLIIVLDHLGIEHDDGLTESEDLSRIGTLDAATRAKLTKEIEQAQAASAIDATLYFDYMKLQTQSG